MTIISYILTFFFGAVFGMILCALLASSRHNIDETQTDAKDKKFFQNDPRIKKFQTD